MNPFQPEEPTKFYTWCQYTNPDMATHDDPGTTIVSLMGVQIDNMVISMVNGTMCINPIDEAPISMNFDQYMEDLLPASATTIRSVVFDSETERYRADGTPPPTIHFTRSPEE